MTPQSPRNFTRLAVAIVIAAVVISASALSYSSFEATVTRTVFTGTTTITTQTIASSVTTTVTPITEVTNTACSIASVNPNPPSNLYTDAPIPGYTYTITYNTTNGAVLGGQTQLSCELGGRLPSQLVVPAGVNQTIAAKQEAPLNVTADPELRPMDTNGYSNAFYVNLQTKQLTVIPGVTFSSNYQEAYYYGHPITNGTRLAVPNQ